MRLTIRLPACKNEPFVKGSFKELVGTDLGFNLKEATLISYRVVEDGASVILTLNVED